MIRLACIGIAAEGSERDGKPLRAVYAALENDATLPCPAKMEEYRAVSGTGDRRGSPRSRYWGQRPIQRGHLRPNVLARECGPAPRIEGGQRIRPPQWESADDIAGGGRETGNPANGVCAAG